MENENIDGQEVIETPESEVETVETPSEEVEESVEEKIARLEAEKLDLDEKNKKLYARLKKEEKPALKQEVSNDGLSNKDVLFLAKADVHEDDIDELLEWAKFKKVPVQEAFKLLKSTLDVRNEERRTAQATQIRGGARGSAKVNGEELLAKAQRTGEVPDTTEGMQALFQARLKRMIK